MALAFLALGDSYTVGEGVAPAACWPAQLAARLQAGGVAVAVPRIVATTGWTTAELAARLDAETLTPPHALVTLLIGVNNQYRGLPLDAYRVELRGLLQRAVELAGGRAAHVVVVSTPDWGVTPYAANEQRDAMVVAHAIDALNAIARAEAGAAGARWVDITGISRAPAARDELAADGLHPSAAQYARWVEEILPAAREALGA